MNRSQKGRTMLSNKGFVLQPLGVDDALECMDEDMGVVTVTVAPLQFIQVPVEVLSADLVERSNDASLEQGPDALYGVGVNVSENPLLSGMVDRLMVGVVVSNAQVGRQFISIDSLGFILDRSVDEVMERSLLSVGYALQLYAAVPLDGPGNPSLVALVGPSFALSPNPPKDGLGDSP